MNEDLGIIYVLSNPALDGFLKIGFTRKPDVEQRVRELSKSTSIPLPFELEFDQIVENPQQYERLIHARLNKYRVSFEKEFFQVSSTEAIAEINSILNGTRDPIEAVKSFVQNTSKLAEKYPERFKGDWSVENLVQSLVQELSNLEKEQGEDK